MTDLYFGCSNQEVGHYLQGDDDDCKLLQAKLGFGCLDGCLPPMGTKGYGARFWYITDLELYAVSFWDYTVDTRLNSHSTFFTDKEMAVKEMLPYFESKFPEIYARFPEIRLLHDTWSNITVAEAKDRPHIRVYGRKRRIDK